ncbi:MAG: YigZ family protein [Epsilonproteobacteria bacterium]|nr:YigZ family protein [Campylobacterota bacterium]
MYSIQNHYTSTLEVKQSKFIAHLIPYAEYENTLQELQNEHPKARHFVTAYRYLNEFGQVVESSSDDGEPKGTSGKPSLMVLQGKKLINIAVIVVRYFGGIKLGTGGLVRAYSDAVNNVITGAALHEYVNEVVYEIEFEYSSVRLVDYECEALGVKVLQKQFDTKVLYKIQAPRGSINALLDKLEFTIYLRP